MDATTFLLLAGGSGAPPSGAVPVLGIHGQFFTVNNRPWFGIECSEFSLPKRYLAGEDIRPILDERVGLGFNMMRLWLLNQSVVSGAGYPEGIHPHQYPDFYERIRALAELLGSYGLVCRFTAFTSCDPLMPNEGDQIAHWVNTQEAVRGIGNVCLELVNEYNWGQGQNSPHASLYQMRPSGILASSGSATADAPPPTPMWDFGLYHSNGLDQWQRKVGHNPMEDIADKYHVPAGAGENTRYPDDEQSTVHAYDAAAGAALLIAHACFHSQAGKWSRPFDAIERAAAHAWCNGARSVPLEFQAGRYIHRSDLERHDPPTILRAYERRLADGRGHVVLIRY